jgi:hypothetical protein
MINLYAGRSTTPSGQLTEEQLQFLIDNLEEEGEGDQDYYLDTATAGLSGRARSRRRPADRAAGGARGEGVRDG